MITILTLVMVMNQSDQLMGTQSKSHGSATNKAVVSLWLSIGTQHVFFGESVHSVIVTEEKIVRRSFFWRYMKVNEAGGMPYVSFDDASDLHPCEEMMSREYISVNRDCCT